MGARRVGVSRVSSRLIALDPELEPEPEPRPEPELVESELDPDADDF